MHRSVLLIVVLPTGGCTTAQFKVVGGVFAREAVKVAICAGVIPTGTVAVVGVREARIPVSMITVAVPVFFLSALAVAVKVSVGMGLGKLDKEGAV